MAAGDGVTTVQGDVKNVIKRGGHRADNFGFLGDFWLSQLARNKLDYFAIATAHR